MKVIVYHAGYLAVAATLSNYRTMKATSFETNSSSTIQTAGKISRWSSPRN